MGYVFQFEECDHPPRAIRFPVHRSSHGVDRPPQGFPTTENRLWTNHSRCSAPEGLQSDTETVIKDEGDLKVALILDQDPSTGACPMPQCLH